MLKMAIIGGGSSYSPELVEGIINRYAQLPVTELALVDVESGREKVNVIADLTRRMLQQNGLEQVTVSVHFELDDAIRGASFVLTQLRVGQLAARAADERLGLKYGRLGQETTGVGGFAKALRTIPVMLNIARKVEELAPDAFIINFIGGISKSTEWQYNSIFKRRRHMGRSRRDGSGCTGRQHGSDGDPGRRSQQCNRPDAEAEERIV